MSDNVVRRENTDLTEGVWHFLTQAKSSNTLRAYRTDWRHFEQWCRQKGREALPATPETLSVYLAERAATCKVCTLERRLAAVSQAHQMAGQPSPTSSIVVRTLMAGVRRAKSTTQTAKKPLLTKDVQAMIGAMPDGILGIRDRALLLLGFAGAFRRSEIVSLDVADLNFGEDGLVVHLRRSKTDQEGEGRKVGIPYGSNPDTCPVRTLQAWLREASIVTGPAFRSVNRHGCVADRRLTSQSIALIVKRYAAACGKDATAFGGHSLRAGHATQAAANGATERSIMNQTGHRSFKMVRKYIREGSLFRENAASKLGL